MLKLLMLPLFAASTLEKIHSVSPQFWLKVAVFIVALVVAVFVIRRVLQMNKMILGIVAFVVIGLVGFNWIYNRNEPEFLTPLIDKIAVFFPSKGAYDEKQQQDPGKTGGKKSAPAQPAKAAAPAKK